MSIGELESNGFISSSLMTGADAETWYTTVSDDEVINFKNDFNVILNTLVIETDLTDLLIKINDYESIWFINAGTQDIISGLSIEKITVVGNLGQKIKFKGLFY